MRESRVLRTQFWSSKKRLKKKTENLEIFQWKTKDKGLEGKINLFNLKTFQSKHASVWCVVFRVTMMRDLEASKEVQSKLFNTKLAMMSAWVGHLLYMHGDKYKRLKLGKHRSGIFLCCQSSLRFLLGVLGDRL